MCSRLPPTRKKEVHHPRTPSHLLKNIPKRPLLEYKINKGLLSPSEAQVWDNASKVLLKSSHASRRLRSLNPLIGGQSYSSREIARCTITRHLSVFLEQERPHYEQGEFYFLIRGREWETSRRKDSKANGVTWGVQFADLPLKGW